MHLQARFMENPKSTWIENKVLNARKKHDIKLYTLTLLKLVLPAFKRVKEVFG